MTSLTADIPRHYELGELNEYGIVAGGLLYEGTIVGNNGLGYARPLHAGDTFLGFATQQADNRTGAAGEKRVIVKTQGKVKLDIQGAALTDIGHPVFASDENTFTLTQSNHSYIGRIYRIDSSGVAIVAFDTTRGGWGVLAELNDNSNGIPGNSLTALNSSFNQSEVANALASLAAKINALIRQTQ